jgi:hypothetical protein
MPGSSPLQQQCERIFDDTVPGPKLTAKACRLPWSFCRWGNARRVAAEPAGRWLSHLIAMIGALEADGVGFRSLTENIGTAEAGVDLGYRYRAVHATLRPVY